MRDETRVDLSKYRMQKVEEMLASSKREFELHVDMKTVGEMIILPRHFYVASYR